MGKLWQMEHQYWALQHLQCWAESANGSQSTPDWGTVTFRNYGGLPQQEYG